MMPLCSVVLPVTMHCRHLRAVFVGSIEACSTSEDMHIYPYFPSSMPYESSSTPCLCEL